MSARDAAYAEAKRRILVGEWEPGELLSEAAVGEELSMSRTPVHAAFVQLAAEGLLELRSRQGAVVTPIRRADARDLLDMRSAIEVGALRGVLRSIDATRALVTALGESIDAQAAAHAAGDADAFAAADEAFHRAVIEGSGNRVADELDRQLSDRQQRLRRQALGNPSVDQELLIDEHRLLLDAVQQEDVDRFGAVLHPHVSRQLGAL